MSRGIIPPSFQCTGCRGKVFGSDAVLYEGLHFHDHCLPSYFAKEEAYYEKRKRMGKISLAENFEYNDIIETDLKFRRAKKEPELKNAFYPQEPRFKGNTRISLESIRMKSVRSIEEMKQLGLSRKEYLRLVLERKAKREKKYLNIIHADTKMLPPGAAGEITTCQKCGKRSFCFDGECHECLIKTELKYITLQEDL